MANTLDNELFQLIDRFAGQVGGGPLPNLGEWTEGFATASPYALGTKIQVPVIVSGVHYGFATLTFLKYVKGTAGLAAVKGTCGIKTSTKAPYVVSNDGGEIMLEGPIAIALTTLVDGYYYFFWTGGICPVNLVSGLDGDYVTDGTIAAGKGIVLSDSLSGSSGLATLSALTDIDTAGATTNYKGVAGGFALDADT